MIRILINKHMVYILYFNFLSLSLIAFYQQRKRDSTSSLYVEPKCWLCVYARILRHPSNFCCCCVFLYFRFDLISLWLLFFSMMYNFHTFLLSSRILKPENSLRCHVRSIPNYCMCVSLVLWIFVKCIASSKRTDGMRKKCASPYFWHGFFRHRDHLYFSYWRFCTELTIMWCLWKWNYLEECAFFFSLSL